MPEIQNPNQQGGGQGRDSSSLLSFFVLFLAVFLGMQYFRTKMAPQHAPAPQATQSAQQQPATTPAVQPASGPQDANTVQAQSESSTVIENSLYRITLSNRGGQATSWILKNYKDAAQLHPLDLVNQKAAQSYGYPLSLWTYDAGLRARLAQALFVPDQTASHLSSPASITYTWSSGALKVTKTFSFDNSYIVHATVKATLNGSPVDVRLAWPSALGDQATLPEYSASMLDTLDNGKPDQLAPKKISGGATFNGNYGWAGINDLYFAAVFLPDHPERTSFVSLYNTVEVPRNLKKPNDGSDRAPALGVAIAETTGTGAAAGTIDTRLFAGPKSINVLSPIHPTGSGPSLEKVISFGWWSIISKPLFLILLWLHNHAVSNWGWAILILTFFLNILMLPTRVMMMRSSLKMQRIQPQMDAIKARYAKYKATDPRRQDMNKEVFDLQKKEGVNMFGSCLPMLLQWPLLFGFYRMLSNVIELRQAHWLWLPDLSSPDPLHILPIFFIISMFAVQYLTPSPGVDQQQQRMMAFTMPAVFGFMTWNIGSGLALYWACSNILGIVQQFAMNKTSLGREMRSIAARRAAKKNGKVINARR